MAAALDCIEWSRDWTVYQGVLPRRGEGGKVEHVPYAGYLWVDVDAGDETLADACALIKAADIPPPHIAVLSGSGVHAYWRLSEPISLGLSPSPVIHPDLFKGVLKRLVLAVGGKPPLAHADGSRADTASILRVPGTINHKHGMRRPVRLLRCCFDEPARSYWWWRAHLPAIPVPTPRITGYAPTPNGSIPRWAEKWAQEPAVHGERHNELLKMAVRLRRDLSIPESEVLSLLASKAAHSPGPPIPERELVDMVRWA
jgi:hypothetical protein